MNIVIGLCIYIVTMSSFILLDSTHRDRETYPNPNVFTVPPEKLVGWFQFARTVQPQARHALDRPYDFTIDVGLLNLTTPATVSTSIDDPNNPGNPLSASYVPCIMVDIHTHDFNDNYLISQINGNNPDARFTAFFDKFQYDANGDPLFIHWKCKMRQVMRISRNKELSIRVYDQFGITLGSGSTGIQDNAIPGLPNTFAQNTMLFEFRPYTSSAHYLASFANPKPES